MNFSIRCTMKVYDTETEKTVVYVYLVTFIMFFLSTVRHLVFFLLDRSNQTLNSWQGEVDFKSSVTFALSPPAPPGNVNLSSALHLHM